MGVFKHTVDFIICNGILTVPLSIKAVSHLPKSSATSTPESKSGLKLPAIKSAETGNKIDLFQTYTMDTDPKDMDAAEKRKRHMKQYVEFLR